MTRSLTGTLTLALTIPSLAIAQTGGPDLAKLKNPAALTEKAPDTYKVRLDTSKGPVVIAVNRAWPPIGADRFYNLVKNGFYDECRFFRVLSDFMAQVGINGDPGIQS